MDTVARTERAEIDLDRFIESRHARRVKAEGERPEERRFFAWWRRVLSGRG